MCEVWALTLQSCEVELHKQARLPVGVSRADPHNDGAAVADVDSSGCWNPSRTRTLGTGICSPAAVVNGDRDGQAVVQARDGDLGAVLRSELHGRHLGGDGVVGDVVERERVRLHLCVGG